MAYTRKTNRTHEKPDIGVTKSDTTQTKNLCGRAKSDKRWEISFSLSLPLPSISFSLCALVCLCLWSIDSAFDFVQHLHRFFCFQHKYLQINDIFWHLIPWIYQHSLSAFSLALYWIIHFLGHSLCPNNYGMKNVASTCCVLKSYFFVRFQSHAEPVRFLLGKYIWLFACFLTFFLNNMFENVDRITWPRFWVFLQSFFQNLFFK